MIKYADIYWHYTSTPSFVEIMKNGLLATHYKFLNDSKEIEYGKEIFISICRSYKSLMPFLENIISADSYTDIFLTCFSCSCDDLYQWRSYSPYGGVAIGFSAEKINSAIQDERKALKAIAASEKANIRKQTPPGYYYDLMELEVDTPFIIVDQCFYEKDKLISFIQNQLTELEYEIQNGRLVISKNKQIVANRNECEPIFFDRLIESRLRTIWNKNICCAKHKSFKPEKEVRIIYYFGYNRQDSYKNKYGYGRKSRIAIDFINNKPRIYTCLKEVTSLVDVIMISPHGDKKKTKLLVEMVCDKYGIGNKVKILESESAYNDVPGAPSF